MASKTPKTMSSRLLTMKFMQRGIASSSAASSPALPESDSNRPSKRRRVSEQQSQSPAASSPKIDEKAVQAALEEEERKRQVAIAKQAAELGDTHWVLDIPALPPSKYGRAPKTPLNVVQIGFAQVDARDSAIGGGGSRIAEGGQIRRFNMKKQRNLEKPNDHARRESDGVESDSDSDSGSSDDDDDKSSPVSRDGGAGGHGGAGRGRQPFTSSDDGSNNHNSSSRRKRTLSETSSRRSAERMKAQEYSNKRRRKDVKLNSRPTSISSANASRPRGNTGKGFR